MARSTAAATTTATALLLLCIVSPHPVSSFQPPRSPAAAASPLFRRPWAKIAKKLPSDTSCDISGLKMSSTSPSSVPSEPTGDATPPTRSPSSNPGDDEGSSSPSQQLDGQLGAWIPLASASALTNLGPQQVRVCGLDLAVWHEPLPPKTKRGTAATKWSAASDACPHRLAPLSQGRVDPETGCIECPYHGWQFDGEGTVTSIPQLDDGKNIQTVPKSGNANAHVYPIHAAGDLLFVFLPTSITGESFPQSLLPENTYPYLRDVAMNASKTYYVRELPYSADFLVENFMDPAHIPFAHHTLQSTRDDGRPIDMTVLANNFTHVEVSFKDRSGGKDRDGVLSFQRPAFYHFRTRRPHPDGEMKPNLCIFVTPIEAGKTRVFFSNMLPKWVPLWVQHAGSNRFLNTDTWLHDAERRARMGTGGDGDAGADAKKVSGLKYVYASESDLGVSAFRQWWSKYGFADAPRNTFGPASPDDLRSHGPALTRYQQIDPWVHHSKQCSACRAALRTMKRLQTVSLVGTVASIVFLRGRSPIWAAVGAMLGLWSHNFLRKCATVIEGNPHRSEVADRSVAAGAD